MKTHLDCLPCLLRQTLDAARRFTDDRNVHGRIVREVMRFAADLDLGRPAPIVGQSIHRRLRELTGVEDPYRSAKDRFNELALSMLPGLRESVRRAPDPIIAAVKAAIAANLIDLGAKSSLAEDQARAEMSRAVSSEIHGDLTGLLRGLNRAKNVLYLADNAGEIVVDRLLIEQIGPQRVTVAVRGRAVINDATMDDAMTAGLHEISRVIDNGSDAPGTIMDDCGPEFVDAFRKADLVVSKGQGNFETLSDEDADIFFLLKVKCPVVASHTGLPEGTHAILRRDRNAS